jgi:hypothetical protein
VITRLTNAFSKKLENDAVLTPSAKHPAMALGLTAHPWSIGEQLDAALAVAPADPTTTAPERRKRFKVIEGGHA